MYMKQVVKSWFSWRLTGLMVVMVFLYMAEPVTSQSSNRNNTLIRYYESLLYSMNARYYLTNGESVWSLGSCWGYVSTANCVACFDFAVTQLKECGRANGANAFYNDCEVRYEVYNFFADHVNRAGIVICAATTSPQQVEFRKTVEGLISDLRIAAPKTSDFYAALTREMPDFSATVYAIAQCNLNLSQSVCEDCLNFRYNSLDDCLPSTNGRAI